MAATVKLNVGGKHFEVSRALIDEHSNTMLERLVSDTWNKNPDKTVFIDRDSDIFAHILNYLRYGSIEIPINLPRTMFDRELDYYGISMRNGIIDQESVAKVIDSLVTQLAEAQKKLDVAKNNHLMFLVAVECCNQFRRSRINNPNEDSVEIMIKKSHKLWKELDKTTHLSNKERKDILNTYLERHFGLTVAQGANI
ncbi:hypothetical protein ACHAWF_016834, partial [Thalassiosira exigua]